MFAIRRGVVLLLTIPTEHAGYCSRKKAGAQLRMTVRDLMTNYPDNYMVIA